MISHTTLKTFGGLALLIALSITTHWHWLFLPGIFTSGDFWYVQEQGFLESLSVPNILDATGGLAVGTATPTFFLLSIIAGILAKMHLGFAVWERIVFLWPIALLSPIPIYFFLMRTMKYQPAAFVGSLVYLFNTYVLSRETVHLHIAIAYFLAPALFLVFEDLVKKQSKKSIILFIAITAASSTFEIRILYICSLVLMAYGIFLLATKTIKPTWKLLRTLLWAIVPLLLLQSYWLSPFIFSKSSLGYNAITGRTLFISFSHLQEASTLSEPFWNGSELTAFIPQGVPWWAYGIPLAALIWILFKKDGRNNALFWFWTGIALVGIFLVKQANFPFPNAYQWIFTHLPGFRLFRDASKFSIVIGLAYALLVSASVTAVRKKSMYLSYALIAGVSAIMLINTIPFITGSIGTMTISRVIPPEFPAVQTILEEDMAFGRTLWVPSTERFLFASQTHPRLSLSNLMGVEWLPFLTSPSDPFSILSQPIIKSLLNFSSITYIGEPADAINDIYIWYTRSKAGFAASIASIPGIQKIANSPQSIPIWKNPDAKPHVYLADNIIAVHGPLQRFSGTDPSIHTAFVFQPDVLEETFQKIVDHVATNNEFMPFLPENISVQQGLLTTKQTIPASSSTQTIIKNEPHDILATLSIQRSDTTLTLVAKKPDGNQTLAETPNTKQDYAISVNEKKFFYTYASKNDETTLGTVRLHPSQNTIVFYEKIESDPLVPNPSFEEGTWGVGGDCNNVDSSPAAANSISATQSTIATEGKYSLSLTAGRHLGCTATKISSVSKEALYIGSFDYRLVTGEPGRVKILQESPAVDLASIQLRKNNEWQHADFSFTTDGKNPASMYLYQSGNDSVTVPAQSLFDNFKVHAYQLIASKTADLADLPSEPILKKQYETFDTNIADKTIDGSNLLGKSPFTKETEQSVGDCNNIDKTPLEANGIKASFVDLGDGLYTFSIQAKKHLACVSLPISSFDPSYNYLLSVTYQTINTTAPHIRLYPNDGVPNAMIELPKTGELSQTYKTIVSGSGIHDDAALIIYVPSGTGTTKALFSDISLTRIPILPATFVTTTNESLTPLKTSQRTINATTHILQVADIGTSPRLLVLSDRYAEGWKVFVRPQDSKDLTFIDRIMWKKPGIEVATDSHIKANGFVNGWIIDPQEIQAKFGISQNMEFVIEYWPQRFMDIGTAISATTLLGYILFTIITALLSYRSTKHESI